MFDRERTIYAFLQGYAQSLAADVDDARFADQPSPGVNPPAWLLGHLAVAADLGVALLGGEAALEQAWRDDFGPGSTPRSDRASYPSKAELLLAYASAHSRLDQAAASADPARLERRHPLKIESLQKGLPTIGDLVAHLLTSHEASHIGHLSNWRRQMGLPYLF
jgi:hypothetical protein